MFIHVAVHDSKFLNRIRNLYETVAPGEHRFIVCGHIGSSAPEWAEHAMNAADAGRLVCQCDDVDGLLTHGLSFGEIGDATQYLDPHVPVAWCVWGYEAYTFWRRLRHTLLQAETKRLMEAHVGRIRRLKYGAQAMLGPLRARTRRGLARIDYCVTPLREEHELFVRMGLRPEVQFHWGHEGLLHDTIDLAQPLTSGSDIQVGNSASWANNHVDAFRLLRGMALSQSRVFVPLSYGDPVCRDAVSAAGTQILGERLCPVVEFMALEEYSKLLARCGHVVMNHNRQEAFGNILGALWRGSQVYLNDTMAFRGLRDLGFQLRPIADAMTSGRALHAQSVVVGEWHRGLLLEEFGHEKVVAQTGALLDKLQNGSGR